MYYRRKLALSLLRVFGGRLGGSEMQKFLFLVSRHQKKASYEFVPYNYGCFSFQADADRRTLIKYGLLKDEDGWTLRTNTDYSASLRGGDITALLQVKKRYSHLRGNALLRRVYTEYPFYAINSEIIEDVLDESDRQIVERARPRRRGQRLFTMGYEGVSFERFLTALLIHDIRLVCDVRRNPVSMKFGFSRRQLLTACRGLDIEYVHIPELGIASNKRRSLAGQKDYEKLFEQYERKTLKKETGSLEHIRDLIVKWQRIVLVCFEASPLQCHRGRVASALQEFDGWDARVQHIAA